MNYDKKIHKKEPISLPYLCFEGWTLTITGLVSPDGKHYTPQELRLLEWKAGFYDRGKRKDLKLYPNPE